MSDGQNQAISNTKLVKQNDRPSAKRAHFRLMKILVWLHYARFGVYVLCFFFIDFVWNVSWPFLGQINNVIYDYDPYKIYHPH